MEKIDFRILSFTEALYNSQKGTTKKPQVMQLNVTEYFQSQKKNELDRSKSYTSARSCIGKFIAVICRFLGISKDKLLLVYWKKNKHDNINEQNINQRISEYKNIFANIIALSSTYSKNSDEMNQALKKFGEECWSCLTRASRKYQNDPRMLNPTEKKLESTTFRLPTIGIEVSFDFYDSGFKIDLRETRTNPFVEEPIDVAIDLSKKDSFSYLSEVLDGALASAGISEDDDPEHIKLITEAVFRICLQFNENKSEQFVDNLLSKDPRSESEEKLLKYYYNLHEALIGNVNAHDHFESIQRHRGRLMSKSQEEQFAETYTNTTKTLIQYAATTSMLNHKTNRSSIAENFKKFTEEKNIKEQELVRKHKIKESKDLLADNVPQFTQYQRLFDFFNSYERMLELSTKLLELGKDKIPEKDREVIAKCYKILRQSADKPFSVIQIELLSGGLEAVFATLLAYKMKQDEIEIGSASTIFEKADEVTHLDENDFRFQFYAESYGFNSTGKSSSKEVFSSFLTVMPTAITIAESIDI